MLLRVIRIVVLVNIVIAALATPARPQSSGVVQITQMPRADGTQQVWEISRDRLSALPALDQKATRLRLSLVDAIGIAEKHATSRAPNVKSWQVLNAALMPLVTRGGATNAVSTLASWYYRVQLAPEVGSPEPLFPGSAGDAQRTTVVVLLDGSIVEPTIQTSPRPGAAVSPLVPGTSDVYLANPGAGIVPPKPTKSPTPRYTPEAKRRRIQGDVSLQCVVNTDGRCEDIKIIASLDNVYGLDERAVETARDWRFTPGMLNGKPVKVRINIDFSFNLRD